MLGAATLTPASGAYYSNGYTFGAVSTFVVIHTGLEVTSLLQLVYPLVSASLVLITWPLYRDMLGSSRGATLATLILFIQPEFLFVVLRGSHERFLRALIMVAIFLLLRSFRITERPGQHATYVLLFYLAVYGAIATNSLFGSSFVWALTIALVGSWFGGYLGPSLQAVSQATRRRLIYVPVLCLLLAFLFNSYIYPAAGAGLSQLPSIADRLSRLLLTTSPETAQNPAAQAYDPYAVVWDQWVDPRIYFLLSIGTYVLMAASAVIWGRTGLRWLARSNEPPTLGLWLLWLMYGAFALQGALSIVADRAGALGGNLQHRSFPSFVLVAAPVVAYQLLQWRPGPLTRAMAASALGVLTLFAIVKSTNEPMLSNKWTFYLPAETRVLSFASRYLRDRVVWYDFDERLRAVMTLTGVTTFEAAIGSQEYGLRTYILSDVVRLRSSRLSRPVPPVAGELRVYDNGGAQIYRVRARTPFQD